MNRGLRAALAVGALLIASGVAVRLVGRAVVPGVVLFVIFAGVAVALLLLVTRMRSTQEAGTADGQPAWTWSQTSRFEVGAAVLIAVSAAVMAVFALVVLIEGSPGEDGYGCEFYQVTKGAVTCVDETAFHRAGAAEQSFVLAIAAGFVAFEVIAFAGMPRDTAQSSPIWSGVDHDADWQ